MIFDMYVLTLYVGADTWISPYASLGMRKFS